MFILVAFILVLILITFATSIYFLSKSPQKMTIQDSHILITGGSSGIGKALASKAVQDGARVTLVARDEVKLDQTKKEIAALVPNGKERVQTLSVDLAADFSEVKKKFEKCQITPFGPVSFLFNCAGGANPGRFDEVPISDFQKMINLNYISAVQATRAVLPQMKEMGRGRIVFVSSQAGQLGLFGFTAYSASKFALRGLAESLQMEVKPYNVFLTLAFPPDTDTPGFEQEKESKPEETHLISETAGLFSPEHVASIILRDTVIGRFFCSIGIDGYMLSNVTCGFSPVTNFLDAMLQVVSMGIFRFISLFYLYNFDRIVHFCKVKKDSKHEVKKNE